MIELSRRIVALAPNDANSWDKLARTQIELKEYDRCQETLQAWEKAARPAPAAIDDFKGLLALARKDYPNAERHWMAFLARKPSRENAAAEYDNLAELCAVQSRWLDHEKYRANAIAAEDSAARRVAHAAALLRLHRWDAAFAEMSKANKIDSTDAAVKEWLPQLERLQKFLPQIRELDARIAKSPDDAGLLLQRARLFTLADRPLLALDDAERAMKLQPASLRACIETAEALQDTGKPEDAAKLQVSHDLVRAQDRHVSEQALRELSDADARVLQEHDAVEPLAARSKTLCSLHQFILALADAQAALARDSKSAAAHFQAAQALDQLGRSRDALEESVHATQLDPSNAEAWHLRGKLEAERADFAAAIDSQSKSLALRESVAALRERENCERRMGKIKEADVDLARLQQLGPENP
jgi:tetratricopeptide (TPR) repeat protein